MEEKVIRQEPMTEVDMNQQLALPANYERRMTPDMVLRVNQLKASIDMHDRNKVTAFGSEEQSQIGNFSKSILEGVSTQAVGEAGALLVKVIGDINNYNTGCANETNRFFAFFRNAKSQLKNMQTKFRSLDENMESLCKDLNAKDMAVCQVSRNFDTMYDDNWKLCEFLTMVIFAGEQALAEETAKYQKMHQDAVASGDSMLIQEAADFKGDITRFERRLYDLKVTRTIAIQQAPQIRSIQQAADEVSDSIKSTISTAIPLWRNQMAMALGMKIVKDGHDANHAVKNAINEALLKNSQMHKQLTLEAAQAVERGVVDIETINTVNQNLIEALNGSYEIAQRAKAEREANARQLKANEDQLRDAVARYARLN